VEWAVVAGEDVVLAGVVPVAGAAAVELAGGSSALYGAAAGRLTGLRAVPLTGLDGVFVHDSPRLSLWPHIPTTANTAAKIGTSRI